MTKLVIKNVVFCENIRPELYGKYTLLGAAAPEWSVTLPKDRPTPMVIMVAVFVEGMPSEMGPFKAQMKVLNAEKIQTVHGNLEGDFNTNQATSIVLGPLPVPIDKDGDYSFEWNFGDGWTEIGKLKINILDTAVTTPLGSSA